MVAATNVDHLQRRVHRHEVAATQPAELPEAHFGFVVGGDIFGALDHLHRVGPARVKTR